MILLIDFGAGWDSLSGLAQIYWLISIPFSIIFIIQLVLSFLGGDMDSHDGGSVDSSIEGDHGLGFHFFTFKNMTAFFTIFGWSGLACIKGGMGTTPTLIISILCGLVIMFIMAAIFYYTSKMTESGTMNIQNAAGKACKVYLTVPANRKGTGKVHITIQSQLRELDAVTDDAESIPTGASAECLSVSENNILIITKK